MGRKRANSKPDALIARLAARQHGVVSADQLARAGLGDHARRDRVAAGHLHSIHRAVYAVGHAGLSQEGRWMAAVLACGPTAVLSHISAACLWGMLRRGGSAPSHITVRTEAGRRRRAGIVVHRSRTLTNAQTTRRLGIPVTNPSRTLQDLRRVLSEADYNKALREAEFLRLPIAPELEPDHTRSELESRFLALCRRHRIPRPVVNAKVGPFTVDFLWPEWRLIVEVDGYRAHGGRTAFEEDRARDVELELRGYQVIRFTWRQITERPRKAMGALRRLTS